MSKARIAELRKLLEEYSLEYYNTDKASVSDFEYDKLYRELELLEIEYNDFSKDSITQRVGAEVISSFVKKQHKTKMMSLANAYSKMELKSFLQKIVDEYGDIDFCCELKIDGLAMSYVYENNQLLAAVTRGNGTEGEDVTANAKTIRSLPLEIVVDSLEVRGEVFIKRSIFKEINKKRLEHGQTPFANPRNMASGTMRTLDHRIVYQRKLDTFIYSVQDDSSSHYDSLQAAKKLGFNVNENIAKVKMAGVLEFVDKWELKREQLDYETDGIVVKVDNLQIREELGVTAKAPKWAIAYKYKTEEEMTVINDITFQVGRSGKVTPVAHLDSVLISGSVVSKATLHNEDYIKNKDIRVGDTVIVHKAGEIIPEVVSVIMNKRKMQQPFQMIDNCPTCEMELVKIDANYFCLNEACPSKILRKLQYFVSKDGLEIDGFGDNLVATLVENKYLNSIEDIYLLKNRREDLLALDKMGEVKLTKLLKNIEKSKVVTVENFIRALGINHVGAKVSQILVNYKPTIPELQACSVEELAEIDDIGLVIAKSVHEYLNSEYFTKLYKNLCDFGFEFETKSVIIKENIFTNKKVCITGTLKYVTRNQLKQELESFGANVVNSISSKTDYLIVGENAGSKLQKAHDLGVRIMNEDEYLDNKESL